MMPLRIHVVHHLSSELEILIRGIPDLEHGVHRANQQLKYLEESIMTVSTQVQAAVDAIAQTKSLVASVDGALKAEAQQIVDLKAQVQTLQDTINNGGTLSADDIAALAQGVNDLQAINTQLQADVPANTEAAPAADPAVPTA